MSDLPKVLIVVSGGGVANYVHDGEVEIEIFDWGKYKKDPVGTSRVSAEFTALAHIAGVPCEKEIDD